MAHTEFKSSFLPGQDFHLLFKSHGGVFLFRNAENHRYFLQKFSSFLLPVFNVYAWSTLGNHAHFVVSVKQPEQVVEFFHNRPDLNRSLVVQQLFGAPHASLLQLVIERQVNSMMVSYAHAYNKYYNRKGGLFQSPFRRSVINDPAHLRQSIVYVHKNAEQHGLVKDFRHYPFSSYDEILNGYSPLVDVNAVLRIFDGKERFVDGHLFKEA